MNRPPRAGTGSRQLLELLASGREYTSAELVQMTCDQGVLLRNVSATIAKMVRRGFLLRRWEKLRDGRGIMRGRWYYRLPQKERTPEPLESIDQLDLLDRMVQEVCVAAPSPSESDAPHAADVPRQPIGSSVPVPLDSSCSVSQPDSCMESRMDAFDEDLRNIRADVVGVNSRLTSLPELVAVVQSLSELLDRESARITSLQDEWQKVHAVLDLATTPTKSHECVSGKKRMDQHDHSLRELDARLRRIQQENAVFRRQLTEQAKTIQDIASRHAAGANSRTEEMAKFKQFVSDRISRMEESMAFERSLVNRANDRINALAGRIMGRTAEDDSNGGT